MSDEPLDPLPPDLNSLLAAERRREPADGGMEERLLARIERTVASPAPSRRSLARLVWVPALAAAAALALVSFQHTRSAALPEYEVAIVSEDVATRGAPATGPAMQSGAVLEVQLTPSAASTTPAHLEARAFTVHEGRVQPWRGELAISPKGAVRLRADVDATLDPPEGEWEIVVALANAGAAPLPESAIASGAAASGEWRIVRRSVSLLGRRAPK